jgi:hypothetical protein
MSSKIDQKFNSIYEWGIDHMFMIIGFCCCLLLALSFLRKSNFTNIKNEDKTK